MRICQNLDQDISYKVFFELNLIKEAWDALLPEDSVLSSKRLKVMQDCRMEDVSFAYLQVFRKNQCVGLMYCQIFRFHAGHYSADLLDNTSIQLVRNFILKQETGLLICGNLFHLNEPGFYFPQKEDMGLLFQILDHFGKKCPVKVTGILVKDAGSGFRAEDVEDARFRPFEKDIQMEIPIHPEWQDFDTYLSGLSKKYRQRAAKILAAKEPLELKCLGMEELEFYATDIERLYQNVRQKQTFRLGSLNARYFIEMKKALGEKFKVKAWFLDGEMLAFSSLFTHPGNALEVHYIGFEYTLNEKYSLYFNIIFDGILEAIQSRNRVLLLGRTGYDAKASAGAIPVNGNHFFKIKRGIPSLAFRYFSNSYRSRESEDWRKRNPFKSVHPSVELSVVG